MKAAGGYSRAKACTWNRLTDLRMAVNPLCWLPLLPPANKRDMEGNFLVGLLLVLGVGVFGEPGALGVGAGCYRIPGIGSVPAPIRSRQRW